MVRDFEVEIEVAEERLEAIIARMEPVQQDFIAATTEFIKPWYWQQAESIVKRKADLTKRLGVEKLSQLKSDVRALQENAANIVVEFLSDESLWWHRKHGDQTYSYFGNRPPDRLDKAVRLIAGKLAPILENYGYLATDSQDHEVWREWDHSGNYHPPGARPYYTYGLDWSGRMRALVKDYEDLHRESAQQASEVEKLKEDKERSEAEGLWNKA